jgi:hypothetical protein
MLPHKQIMHLEIIYTPSEYTFQKICPFIIILHSFLKEKCRLMRLLPFLCVYMCVCMFLSPAKKRSNFEPTGGAFYEI